MNRATSSFLLLALLALPAAASAQPAAERPAEEGSDAKPETVIADEVDVVAPAPGYLAESATSASKTSTPIAELPQAVTVITAELVEDTNAQGLQDALSYAAGVRSDAFGLDSRTDSMLVRGAYPDEYLDGMRQTFNYYTSTTRTDPFLLERIEVLRGPASVLYGQGTTGGVISLVSKRPTATPTHEVGVQLGSFGRRQLQADLGGALTADGRWLYRLVALGRDSDTQVDHVPDDRALVAPSLTWRPSRATSLTLQLRWQRDESGSTLQFFPWEGTVEGNPNGRIPTDVFLGEPGFDRYDSERLSGGWLLEHRLGERWTLRQNTRLVRNEVDYRSLYADSFSSPGDSFLDDERRLVGRYAWVQQPVVDMWTADQHAEGRFTLGGVEHQVLVGVDALGFRQRSRSASDFPEHLGGGVPAIDVFDPVPTGFAPPPLADDPRSAQRQAGVYLQDQVEIGRRWIVLAGLRHDRVESELEGAADEESDATTGRLGVMWEGAGGWSPYASYSESFTPVAGTNLAGERFDPLAGEQVEVGLKVQPPGAPWMITAAAFELREENRLIADPRNPLDQVQAGRTRTTGFELEVAGHVARGLDLRAHYNQLDNDEQLDGVPEHQAAAWATKSFDLPMLRGVEAGLGLRWMSAFRDGAAPRVPEAALVDAMIAWERASWRLALNAQNLGDDAYVTTCLPRGDCFYGARRTVALTAGYRF